MVYNDWNTPGSPNRIPWTPVSPTPDQAALMLEILRKLKELDEKLDARDCSATEKDKKAFEKKLKKRASKKKTSKKKTTKKLLQE